MKPRLTVPAITLAAILGSPLAASAERGRGPMMDHMGDGSGMEMMFDKADIDGDGKVSPDEFKAATEARFKAADTNGDGQLSADEMVAAAEARREEMRKAREMAMAETMIDRRDTNHDGMLSLDEMTPGDPGARFLKRFDRDGDGFVSEDEMKMAMNGHGRMPWHRRGPGGEHGRDRRD